MAFSPEFRVFGPSTEMVDLKADYQANLAHIIGLYHGQAHQHVLAYNEAFNAELASPGSYNIGELLTTAASNVRPLLAGAKRSVYQEVCTASTAAATMLTPTEQQTLEQAKGYIEAVSKFDDGSTQASFFINMLGLNPMDSPFLRIALDGSILQKAISLIDKEHYQFNFDRVKQILKWASDDKVAQAVHVALDMQTFTMAEGQLAIWPASLTKYCLEEAMTILSPTFREATRTCFDAKVLDNSSELASRFGIDSHDMAEILNQASSDIVKKVMIMQLRKLYGPNQGGALVDTEIADIIAGVVALDRSFGWLQTEDPLAIRRVVNSVQQARAKALEKGETVSDLEIYRRYKYLAEYAEGNNKDQGLSNEDRQRYLQSYRIINAFFKGNPRRNNLPF